MMDFNAEETEETENTEGIGGGTNVALLFSI
jgi:hypothetical protein